MAKKAAAPKPEPKESKVPVESVKPIDAVVRKPEGSKKSATTRSWVPWALGGAAILIGAGIVGALTIGHGPSKTTTKSNANTSGVLTQRALDGVLSDAQNPNPVPIGVMIENHTDARPQSGLDQASVVYEALAEGGITRFLAIFGPFSTIPEIGPVRSARPYYVDFAEEYGAVYAHVGGSPQALAQLASYKGVDLNEFFNNRYFWREKTRRAPHNVYTSSDKLIFARRDKKVAETATYTPWPFASTAAAPLSPSVTQSVAIEFSSFNYNVSWNYDATKNVYARLQAGSPHVMKNGTAITASNVIIQFVDASLIDTERLSMKTTGTGRAIVLSHGVAVTGTWEKDQRGDHTRFLDSNGNPVTLNPGVTWVEVVPNGRTVTLQPKG